MQELEKILKDIDREVEEYMEIDFGDEYNAGIKDMAKMAKKIINKHMNDGWISVEERLPEDDRMVLVTCQTKKGIRSVNRAYCDGAFWHGSGSMSGVIAWRPMPEVYRQEGSEGE